MPNFSPIQTAYNGHHFRSRLEARWAVFFDALGVKYEYEAEGYDLDGVWYLPDFWLPEMACYVEIKPADPDMAEGLMLDEKAFLLAVKSDRTVLTVYGPPWPGAYGANYATRHQILWFPMEFALSVHHARQLWLTGKYGAICISPENAPRGGHDKDNPLLDDAYRAARSARFEHGESGRTL